MAMLAVGLATTGCASGNLEIWHTTALTEDFTAKDDDASFADYLAIEARAFDELDEKIVSEVGTGPEYTLVRYSRGSASNPDSFPQNYNRSYELVPAAPRGGALLLHGMSDSPYSLSRDRGIAPRGGLPRRQPATAGPRDRSCRTQADELEVFRGRHRTGNGAPSRDCR